MKIIWINVVMNLILTIIFVTVNVWAVKMQLEETFVSVAIMFGFITTIINAAYLIAVNKKINSMVFGKHIKSSN